MIKVMIKIERRLAMLPMRSRRRSERERERVMRVSLVIHAMDYSISIVGGARSGDKKASGEAFLGLDTGLFGFLVGEFAGEVGEVEANGATEHGEDGVGTEGEADVTEKFAKAGGFAGQSLVHDGDGWIEHK